MAEPGEHDGGEGNGKGKSGVAAVEKALSLLDAFHDAKSSLSLADLAAHSGLFKSGILRIMVSLEKHRYVQRLDSGRYALGSAAFDLGNAYRRTFSLFEVVRPVLEKLATQTQESASFWQREGEYRLCLCRVESSQRLRDAQFRKAYDRIAGEPEGIRFGLRGAFRVYLDIKPLRSAPKPRLPPLA